jgi:peptidoglycan/LPS O-acetylase OafA/YrhL
MQYNPALDGIRALSILIVVLFHCQVPGFSGGFAGLDIFFVLSGYLITMLLAAEYRNGGIEVGRFYARRALRLYPSLLLLIAVYLAASPFIWPHEDPRLVSLLSAFYMLDYGFAFLKNLPLPIGPTWSLSVEEKFYLLWPLLLPVLLRTRRPVAWLLAAFVAVTAWRGFVTATWGWPQAYFSFDTRMSGILLGAIAALARIKISLPTLIIACVVLALNIAAPIPPAFYVDPDTMPRIILAELSAFVLISYIAEHGDNRFLTARPLVYIGKLSYGIFLWHGLVVFTLRGQQPVWIIAGAALLFSFAMAAICLHCIDLPLRRWRERTWAPSRRVAAAAA